MQLTTDQKRGIERGEAVPVTVGQTECVVIRKDVFDQVKTSLYEDSELTDDELSAIAARTLDDLDSAGPIP